MVGKLLGEIRQKFGEVGSEPAKQRNVEIVRRSGHDPEAYLKWAFERLPGMTNQDNLRALLPAVREPNESTAILNPTEMELIRGLNGIAAIRDAESIHVDSPGFQSGVIKARNPKCPAGTREKSLPREEVQGIACADLRTTPRASHGAMLVSASGPMPRGVTSGHGHHLGQPSPRREPAPS